MSLQLPLETFMSVAGPLIGVCALFSVMMWIAFRSERQLRRGYERHLDRAQELHRKERETLGKTALQYLATIEQLSEQLAQERERTAHLLKASGNRR